MIDGHVKEGRMTNFFEAGFLSSFTTGPSILRMVPDDERSKNLSHRYLLLVGMDSRNRLHTFLAV